MENFRMEIYSLLRHECQTSSAHRRLRSWAAVH
jgi:hypothetical protein